MGRNIGKLSLCVKHTMPACVSLMKMSPLTAVLKCPHYEKGYFNNESEREAEVPSLKDGVRECIIKISS